jgi:hypothetical protein
MLTRADLSPKNRKNLDIKVIEIRIRHLDGVIVIDPVTLILKLIEDANIFLDLCPLDNTSSVISGKPAVLYQAAGKHGDIEIPLTTEELVRYMSHNLTHDEFFKLMKTYGEHFEIHADFYNYRTGKALQPLEVRR